MLGSETASAALVAIVAGWLAQAEPAPPEQPPDGPATPAPVGPAEAAPPEQPANAGPVDPAPAAASPAPPPSSTGEPDEVAARPTVNSVAVHARLATRATGPDGSFPREGFSLGGAFEHRYAGVGVGLGLGVGLDFFFDHFASGGTQNSFVALQTLVFERVPVRPWIAVGPGLAVAGSTRAVVRGAVGLELAFSRQNALAVRADLTHALSGDRAFGDLVDVGVGLMQRF
jgi:hypothetical protein